MPNHIRNRLRQFSPLSALIALDAGLFVCYLGLVAFSMSYAALEVQFSQSVKNDEASVASLDTAYLSALQGITTSDYAAEGYANPVAELSVPKVEQTAFNFR